MIEQVFNLLVAGLVLFLSLVAFRNRDNIIHWVINTGYNKPEMRDAQLKSLKREKEDIEDKIQKIEADIKSADDSKNVRDIL